MIPCEQATTIVKIETTLDHVVTLLEKHEDREERMLGAMETVAAQTETIKALSTNDQRHEKDIDELYHLVRGHLENKENLNFPLKVWTSEAGNYLLGAVAIGAIIDLTVHFDLIKSIWGLFK